MTWIITEGVDRSGKSTLAKKYEEKGYEYIHFSAPDRKYYEPGYTGPSYLDDIITLLVEKSGQNVVFDRSWYGEACIWPFIYRRTPLLNSEDIDILMEIENQNDTQRILMYDENIEEHWRRCVENKEPLKRTDFNSANQLYNDMASRYNFKKVTFNDIDNILNIKKEEERVEENPSEKASEHQSPLKELEQTPEQQKLQQANVINDILSSRIIRKKGSSYDVVESKLRGFLREELSVLLGTSSSKENPFSQDEIKILKALINRVVSKA
jgi:hypothetical protein